MIQGSSPIQLSQLNVTPALQAAALEQQGIQEVTAGLQTAILGFAQKQQEKKIKNQREAQLNTFMPQFLENMGIGIEAGSPEYSALIKYINNTSGGDIMSVLKAMGDLPTPTVAPTLETVTGPGGQQVYTFDGTVVDPDKVFDPNAPEAQSLGFGSEYPRTYLVNYDDGGTPDDPSDDTEAYRVLASQVNEVSPGLKDRYGNTITKGQQVYYDNEGKLNVLDLTKVTPMSDSSLVNLEDRLNKSFELYNQKVQETKDFKDYIGTRGRMSDSGGTRFLEQLSFAYKNLVGDDAVTEAEYATAEGKAKFRQQLGSLRIPILGPGVLTEFDRQVIEEAIGGFGVLKNNQLAINLVNQYLEKSIAQGVRAGKAYNELYRQAPREIKLGMSPVDLSEIQGNLIIQPQYNIQSDFSVAFDSPTDARDYLISIGAEPGTSFKFGDKYYTLKPYNTTD